jgi:putative transposase
VQQELAVLKRRACRVLRQPRSTQRRTLVARDDEDALTRAIVDLASEYGRYGYRRITALLRHQGWHVNHKRVERIWRRDDAWQCRSLQMSESVCYQWYWSWLVLD